MFIRGGSSYILSVVKEGDAGLVENWDLIFGYDNKEDCLVVLY